MPWGIPSLGQPAPTTTPPAAKPAAEQPPAQATSAPASPYDTPAWQDTFEGRVDASFNSWDRDKDGHIDQWEINKAVLDKSVKDEDAAAAAALKKSMGRIEDLSNDEIGPENDGVTRSDMKSYARLRAKGNSELVNDTESRYGVYKHRIANQSRDLFPRTPNAHAVKQGAEDNCYVMAAGSSLAAQDPERLKKVVKDNGDGTYTAKVHGEDVKVEAPTDGEIALYGRGGKNGMWVSVLDKAYATREAPHSWPISDMIRQKAIIPQDLVSAALSPKEGIEAVTGNEADGDMTMFTAASTTRDKLESAMRDKRIVTASIRNELPVVGVDNKDDDTGLIMGHAYSVTGYDRAKDQVTIRNPHGHGERTDKPDGKDDGVFTMTVGEFDDTFTEVAYEER